MNTRIISLIVRKLKGNRKLLFLASRVYTMIYSPSLLFMGGISGAFLRHVKIKVHGRNNQVTISPKVMMRNCAISISGDNCKVYIEGGGTNIQYCTIEVKGAKSEVIIKKGFTSEQVSFHACEGRKIVIGEDCMFSAGIYITTSDFHSIFDVDTEERLNPAKDVVIGNHVWLGYGVSILKGAEVQNNVVVGKDSTVTRKLDQLNSLYVGTPAKIVKSGINWKREL